MLPYFFRSLSPSPPFTFSTKQHHGTNITIFNMFGRKEEPEIKEVLGQRRPSAVDAMSNTHRLSVSNRGLTGASALTVRQSIYPITLVTILFFLWGMYLPISLFYQSDSISRFRIWSPRCSQRQVSNRSQHHRRQSWRFARCLFRSLLYWSFDVFGMDCQKIRLPLDIHRRSLHLRRWSTHVLAFSCLSKFPRFLWQSFHRWIWTINPRDQRQSIHRNLRTSKTV